MNNPINMIKMMMGKMSPKDMAMKMIENNSNPVFANLIDMANKGDTKGVEDFARNICKEKNIDFDKDFTNFMNNFK
jgi:hypothetical protein|nr:MAG TPA_asm: hypothetical protein [Bacteriophage sp.]